METIRHYSMLIGGDWIESDDRFEVRSPATEDVVARVAKGGLEHAAGVWSTDSQRALDLSGRLNRRACALLPSTPPA
jgi:hypothetical protein